MTDVIRVTAQDIANGKRHWSMGCPVSLAIKRKHPRSKIFVTMQIEVNRKYFIIPDNVAAFIGRFDRGRPVKPFAFKLGRPLK